MHGRSTAAGGFAVNESAGLVWETGMLTRYMPATYAHANFTRPSIRYCIRRASFLEKIKGIEPERRHTTHAQSEPEAP
jgi:hypothetical protein